MHKSSTKSKITLFGLLTLAVFLLFVTVTYSWIAIALTPSMQGFDLTAIKGANLEIYAKTESTPWQNDSIVQLNNIMCGSANAFNLFVKIQNNDDAEYKIGLKIDTPNNSNSGYELPLIKDGLYYYLGSQIKIRQISATTQDYSQEQGGNQEQDGQGQPLDISQNAIATPTFLLSTSAQNNGQATFTNQSVNTFQSLKLLSDTPINPNQSIIICVTFEFADNGTDQNVYQNEFGKQGTLSGYCSRRFSVFVE